MDTLPPCPDGDLSELERRLAGWLPDSRGLDADAMLFAAGRASAKSPRQHWLWPGIAACSTLTAVTLGLWLASERAERLDLTQRLAQQESNRTAVKVVKSASNAPDANADIDRPGRSSYLACQRLVKEGLESWPLEVDSNAESPGWPVPSHRILQVRQREELLVQ